MKNVQDIYRLSPMQREMLAYSLYAPEEGANVEQIHWTWRGPLLPEALERAFQGLVDRHPILRTAFFWEDVPEPLQAVRAKVTLRLERLDWTGLPGHLQTLSLAERLDLVAREGFKLAAAPLMRVTLITLGADLYRIVWSYHHLLLDGWSVPLCLHDLMQLYQGEISGRKGESAAPRPYRDYIAWLARQDVAAAKRYWSGILAGDLPLGSLIESRGAAAAAAGVVRYEARERRLPEGVTSRLKAAARRYRLTLNTLVQGAWALLLARHGGSDEVLFGATVSGRPAEMAGVDTMVGLFINTLPVRTRVSTGADLLSWLAALQSEQLAARRHDVLSVSELRDLAGKGSRRLFESLLVVENLSDRGLVAAAGRGIAEIGPIEHALSAVGVPLTVVVVPAAELTFQIAHDSALFDSARVDGMLDHLATLLEAMTDLDSAPVRIGEISLLSAAERAGLAAAVTALPAAAATTVPARFEAQVERTPEAVAIVAEDGQVSYRELDHRANRLAHRLLALGVGPEARVAICLPRSIDLVAAVLAVLKSGAAYVPLDPAHPAERRAAIVTSSGVRLLVTTSALAPAPSLALSVLCLDAPAPELAGVPATRPAVAIAPSSLAYVLYTSGSTGLPRGVLVAHAALASFTAAHAALFALTPRDRVLQFTTFAWDTWGEEVYLALLSGATLVLRTEAMLDPEHLLAACQQLGLTVLNLPTAYWHELSFSLHGAEPARPFPASVRLVSIGGETARADRLAQWHARVPGRVALWNTYGATEATAVSAACLLPHPEAVIPAGTALAGVALHVLDEGGGQVPDYLPGELCIGGAGVARGYLDEPGLTAARFVPDPFSATPGARLFRSGDRARRRDDGKIELLGRRDGQVKIRGIRVELAEVERGLAAHPQIRDAAVVAHDGAAGEPVLTAYLVAVEPAHMATAAELRAFLRPRLLDAMIPSAFVTLAALPLTATGKVARGALPAPGPRSDDDRADGAAEPQSAGETALAALFREVLGEPRVGLHDDFFSLGGNSLLATRLVSRARKLLGVDLPIRAVFAAPTIAGLARIADGLRPTALAPAAAPLQAIPIASRDEPLPLSFSQQRLWFIDQLDPGRALFHLPIALRLVGELDPEALRRAFEAHVDRHEVLRTTLSSVGGTGVQHIHPPARFELPVIDVAAAERPEDEVRRLLAEAALQPFDLARDPMLRARLLRLSDREHVLCVVLHHIASDAWSIGLLVRECLLAYRGLTGGEASALEPLPLQYADYAAWQRQRMSGAVLERELAYFREKLADLAPLDLPTDRPRPALQSYRAAVAETHLPQRTAAAVRALAQAEGATPFMVLLAATQALLGRHAGSTDVAVGSPIAGRAHAELEDLAGCFVNTLVLRTDLGGDPSFRELVQRAKATALGAYAHQEVPFEKLVDELAPARDPSRAPLVQVIVVLQNATLPEITVPGLTVTPVPLPAQTTTVDLWLSFTERADGFQVLAEYSTDLFLPATIARLLARLRRWLAEAAELPERRLSQLSSLDGEERRRLLVDWNGPARPFASEQRIHDLVTAWALRTPQAVAVVAAAGTLTCDALERRANRLARHLIRLGVGPEVRVGLFTGRTLDLVIGALGILKAGGAYVPLDPAYPFDRLAFMMEDSGAAIVVTSADLVDDLPAQGGLVVALDPEVSIAAGELESAPETAASADSAAYVIYTSGSTGKPKGVVLAHRGLCNLVEAQRGPLGIAPGVAVLQFARLGFDASISEIFVTLAAGATLHLADAADLRPGPDLARLLTERAINVVTLPPSALAVLPDGPYPALHTVVAAGETCPPEIAAAWGARVHLVNGYGPTEATVCATLSPFDPATFEFPIGRPLPNTRAYVLGPDLALLPAGTPGELYLAGVGLARGYLSRPGLSAERFLPDPFAAEPGQRMYRTGDRARLRPDGALLFLGRSDDQVKLRGYRVELGEIEAALRRHPAVEQAAVIAREDSPGWRRLVAYVVGEREAATPQALRRHLERTLPDYMVPAAFVALERLPLTAHGKLDRRALPAPEEPTATAALALPRTPAEARLAEIFRLILRRADVGIHDNFFEIGGDSILSIQIVARAQQVGLELTPREIFQHPSIALLAAVARQKHDGAAAAAPELGETTLLPIHHFFFERGLQQPNFFAWSMLVELPASCSEAALEQALRALPAQHDALRLRFTERGGTWTAGHRDSESAVAFERTCLLAAGPEEEARRLAELRDTLAQRLDLARGPLLRAAWIDRGPGQQARLLLVLHHFVADALSWRILLADLLDAHDALCAGQPLPAPPRTSSYRAFARHLAEHARSAALAAELPYWEAAPAGTRPLPRDFPGAGNGAVGSSEALEASLSAETTRALFERVPEVYRTQINDLLLAALAATLNAWSGGETALFDLEGHGREDLFDGINLSRTVGWFTTVFPVALTLDPAAGPGETLQQVKEQLRGVPGRGLGYGLLRHLGDETSRARLAARPAPEVNFNYMGQLGAEATAGHFTLLSSDVPVWHPANLRTHLIDVGCVVLPDGRLVAHIGYSRDRHERATIARVLEDFLRRLRALVRHCLSAAAGGLTPSDFPLAALDQAALRRLAPRPREVEDVYRLSPMQQGMLFHALLDPAAGVYVEQLHAVLDGLGDVAAFERAWRRMVEREPMLRTSFHWEGLAEPVQVVHRHADLPFVVADWRELPPAEQQAHLQAYLESDRRTGFDLGRAPLLRLLLARLDADRHLFVWSHHHILMDGWCFTLILKDLLALHEAERGGKPLPPARPGRFRDHIAWLARQGVARAEQHWTSLLRGFTEKTPLDLGEVPAARAEAAAATAPGRVEVKLSAAVSAALEGEARKNHLTLGTLLHGAWAILLARCTGAADIVFGSTTSGRPAALPGVESIVGLFINSLPLRVRVREDEVLLPWLQRLMAQQIELRDHDTVPLWRIQSMSELPRGVDLFDTLLVFESYPIDEAIEDLGGAVQVSDLDILERPHYPITAVSGPGNEISLRLQFDRARFAEAAVRRLLAGWQTLLTAMATGLERTLGDLPWLPAAEQERLLRTWNDTASALPDGARLAHALVEAQAERAPLAAALATADGEISYAELEQRANRLAHHLRARGVGPEQLVALYLPRGPEMVIAVLAVLKAGGAYLPFDLSYPSERLAFMLDDSGAALVLAQEPLPPALAVPGRSVLRLDEESAEIAGRSPQRPTWPPPPEEAAAYVIYTSGSTGRPKGVVVPHRGLHNMVFALRDPFAIGPGSRVLQFARLGFDASVLEIFTALGSGATLHLAPDEALRPGPDLVRLLGERGIEVVLLPPSTLQVLPAVALSALKTLIVGGEACPPDLARAWSGGRRVVNAYGPTEVTVCATVFPFDPAATALPIGRPVLNACAHVLDAHLRPLPVGIPGELYLGGAGVARGYLGRAALTAERFVPDPFSSATGARLYRTGDLCRRREDGSLDYLGRVDQQVKLRGFRIELGEIEHALRSHPSVSEAAVALRELAPGDLRLVAYVVGQGEVAAAAALRAHLQRTLPEHMLPAAFLPLSALPRSPSGKLDRRSLPAPGAERPHGAPARTAPRTAVEEVLAGLWAEVLRLDQVGVLDNFFELGGHSLLATQLLGRLRPAFGVEVPLRVLFEGPTVAALAAHIEAAIGTGTPAAAELAPAPRDGDLPLSFAQQRLWFLDQLEPESSLYNVATAVRLSGPLSLPALDRSLQEIVRRHEALRTVFVASLGQPRQVVLDAVASPLTVVDLTTAGAADIEAAAQLRADEEAARPFDLDRGPLFRATLLRLGEGEHILLSTLHHIVSDGWSLGVLTRELGVLYQAFAAGLPSPLPELPIQVIDHALWQRRWLTGEVLEGQLAHWRQRLAGAPPLLDLPSDRPRPAVLSFRGAACPVTLPAELVAALAGLCRREGITLFMALLAGFQALLARWSGQDDILVGTPVAGRTRAEMEPLIGFFANTLVLRTDLSGGPSFRELLARVREVTLAAYANQDVPFERLVEELAPERDPGRSPLFQVVLALQNAPLPELALGDVQLRAVESSHTTAKFDLTLNLTPTAEGIQGSLEYSTDLFDAATIARLVASFLRLLAEAAAAPERRLADLGGEIEPDGPPPRVVEIGGQRVDLDAVETALLGDDSVAECAVVAQPAGPATDLTAYVVPGGPFLPEASAERLRALLPAAACPSTYVPITSLPLTSSGRVDEAHLSRLARLDTEQIQHWEERLRREPMVADLGLVLTDLAESPPPLHLSDLIPGWTGARAFGPGASTSPPASTPSASATSLSPSASTPPSAPAPPAPPSISHGGPLPGAGDVPRTLVEALERAAARFPEHGITFLREGGSTATLSYPALLDQAERILRGLRGLGLRPGDLALLQMPAHQDFVATFWGCLLGGIVPVPMAIAPSYAEPTGAVAKLLAAWRMLGRPVLLASQALGAPLRALSLREGLSELRVVTADELDRGEPDREHHARGPDDLAVILLTSGSTGLPKGVPLRDRNILHRSAATAFRNQLGPSDVSLNWLPLDHVGGVVMFHLRDVVLGCRQVHLPTQMVLEDPLLWLDLIEQHRATVTWAPNFAFAMVNDRAEELARRPRELSSMRFILDAGEAIVAQTARRFLSLLAPHGLPGTAVRPGWGMSETSSAVTYSDRFTLALTTDSDPHVEVGAPLPGTSLRIVDGGGQVVPERTIGRLQVRGATVLAGYHDNPTLNAEVFDPEGWFETGDQAFLAEGRLTITGRKKDVIIVNGANIGNHEIEAVVEEVPGVATSYTAACAVRRPGSNTDQIAVFFSPAVPSSDLPMETIAAIRRRVVERLGVNPEYVVPVAREAIPKTGIGKIQRSQLGDRFAAGEHDATLKRIDLLSRNAATLPDWFYRRVWRRKLAAPRAPLPEVGHAVIFLDDEGLGRHLAEALRGQGHACSTVAPGASFEAQKPGAYRLDPREPGHYRRLFAALAAGEHKVDQVIHLWSYSAPRPGPLTPEEVAEASERGLYSLLFLVQGLAAVQDAGAAVKLIAVSSQLSPASAADRVAPEKAAMLGLLKSLPLELPWLRASHVDLEIDRPERNTRRLLAELRLPRGDEEVAYRGAARLVPGLVKAEMLGGDSPRTAFERGGAYLITGGLGGLGALLAERMLTDHGVKLLLLGRTPLPDRGDWPHLLETRAAGSRQIERMLALLATGGEVEHVAADVCDTAAVERAVVAAEARWGHKLSGILHLAGEGNLARHWASLDARWAVHETRESFEAMLRPKIGGARALAPLLAARPDADFIVFSSVNAMFGGATFSAYSAANAALEAFAHHLRRGPHPRTRCFTWSMWENLGMSEGGGAADRDTYRRMGYQVLSGDQGWSSLLAALGRDARELIIGIEGCSPVMQRRTVTRDCSSRRLLAGFTRRTGAGTGNLPASALRDRAGKETSCTVVELSALPRTETGEIDRPALIALCTRSHRRAAERVAPRNDVEQRVAEIWREILGVREIGVHDNFFELGGHSLLATRVLGRIRMSFGLDVPLRALFEAPTVAGIAVTLLHLQADEVAHQDMADLRAQLDGLSEEEVLALLAAETASPGEER